jgi:hypothetical protein
MHRPHTLICRVCECNVVRVESGDNTKHTFVLPANITLYDGTGSNVSVCL